MSSANRHDVKAIRETGPGTYRKRKERGHLCLQGQDIHICEEKVKRGFFTQPTKGRGAKRGEKTENNFERTGGGLWEENS